MNYEYELAGCVLQLVEWRKYMGRRDAVAVCEGLAVGEGSEIEQLKHSCCSSSPYHI
jgi:hypothetical protein